MEKIKLIIGPGGSGKSTIAKKLASLYDSDRVVILDGRNFNRSHFYFSACKEDTELIIIEELSDAKHLMSIYSNYIDGVKVEKQGKEPFYIRPKNIIVTCHPDIKKEDLPIETSNAFNRRFEVIESARTIQMNVDDLFKLLSDVEKDYLFFRIKQEKEEIKSKYDKLLKNNSDIIKCWCRSRLTDKVINAMSKFFTSNGINVDFATLDFLTKEELRKIRNIGPISESEFIDIQIHSMEESLKKS